MTYMLPTMFVCSFDFKLLRLDCPASILRLPGLPILTDLKKTREPLGASASPVKVAFTLPRSHQRIRYSHRPLRKCPGLDVSSKPLVIPSGNGVFLLDGQMIDEPFFKQAERVLEIADDIQRKAAEREGRE